MRRSVTLAGVLGVALSWGGFAIAAEEASPSDAVPPALLPFEHLIGGWKGTSVPKANPLKGWTETHTWAWKFRKGQPVGMTIKTEGEQATRPGDLDLRRRRRPIPPRRHRRGGQGRRLCRRPRRQRQVPADGPRRRQGTADPPPPARQQDPLHRLRRAQGAGLDQVRPRRRDRTDQGRRVPRRDGRGANDGPKCIVTGGAAADDRSPSRASRTRSAAPAAATSSTTTPRSTSRRPSSAPRTPARRPRPPRPPPWRKDDGSFEGLTDEPKPKVAPKAPGRSPRPRPTRRRPAQGRPRRRSRGQARTKEKASRRPSRRPGPSPSLKQRRPWTSSARRTRPSAITARWSPTTPTPRRPRPPPRGSRPLAK